MVLVTVYLSLTMCSPCLITLLYNLTSLTYTRVFDNVSAVPINYAFDNYSAFLITMPLIMYQYMPDHNAFNNVLSVPDHNALNNVLAVPDPNAFETNVLATWSHCL